MFRENSQSEKGFTLVEIVVVIAINTVLMLVITASIVQFYKNNDSVSAQVYEIDSARRGLVTWVRDAREMTYAANGAFPLVKVLPNKFGFYSDIDRDSAVEYVEYELIGTNLYKRIYNPTGYPATYNFTTPSETNILSIYVQNLTQNQATFKYYNDSGVELASSTASISDIRYIEARIIVNIDPVNHPGEFMLHGSATPRNLKDNL
jgi:prepilin-type N-terminal cleavage/methylation domain-containing protein